MRKLVLPLLMVLAAGVASAQEPSPRIAVAPFAVFTQDPMPTLGRMAQDLLTRALGEQGVDAVPSEQAAQAAQSIGGVRDPDEASALGRRLEADYVVYGSLTQVGQRFSLDATLVDLREGRPPQALFAEAASIDQLASATRELTQQVVVHVLAKALIADIQVRGNERIEADAIRINLKNRKGEVLRPDVVREDIKTIYQMGYFESVEAEVSDSPAGKILTFVVREKPTVIDVRIEGNKEIDDKDILAAISTKPYTVLQPNVVTEDVQRILSLYHQKAYFDAEVDHVIQFPKDPRQAVVTFNIRENNKIYIKKIDFIGNHSFSDRKLRSVMETKKRGWFHWFSDKGVLQRDVLETDVDRLTAFYHDQGFMDARVGSPEVKQDGEGFTVEFPIEEGERYRMSSVGIAGDLQELNETLQDQLELKEGDYFSREKLRNDLKKITTAYMDEGYAYTEVNPRVIRRPEDNTADVIYEVHKGKKIHIERITISGNVKTQDKVIRRQFTLAEGDTYSANALERTNLNLKRLDYFEEAEILPSQGTEEDAMNLHVRVKEKSTGSFSVGGGFSSDEGVFIGGDILQRNLFGRGQQLALKAYLGGETQRYSISFTEPWLFDKPLSLGFDIYDWYREYNDFDKDAQGGKVRISHPFGNWSRWHLAYVLEDAEVTDVDDDAAVIIQDQEGRQLKSAVMGSIERDSTDHPFMPTRGSVNSLSLEFSSPYLGSDSDFVSAVIDSGRYFPLFWKFVGFVRGNVGWIVELDEDNPVPIYERFFLGGINSIRAFDWGDVGPEDPETGDSIGGLKFGLVNLELLFPLIEKLGVRGVMFFDAGNAFDDDEDFRISDFRTGAGGGIRWNSPMGPLRIEWGYNLDPEPGESKSKWQFSMGGFF